MKKFVRHRNLRKTPFLRDLVRETQLSLDDLIYPIFVKESGLKTEIASMPGIFQYPLNELSKEITRISKAGIKSIILFGIPDEKDEFGLSAYKEDGVIQKAVGVVKEACAELLVITDTCLCEYTSHGHCGVLENGAVVNDASLELLVKTAVSQAQSGADIIAPSNAMDGFVQAIRNGLDAAGFESIPIMSYAVKYASSFYGPFREAAGSTPQTGDRCSYQMDPANRREALREASSDEQEGADFLMVKPGLAFLDIVREVRQQTNLPVVCYNVSGEYAMVKAAAQNGWIEEQRIVKEILTSMKRAGADLIISYFALEAAEKKWVE